jgi:very-short-patch-repair endonuclease
MNPRTEKKMTKINARLEEFGQKTRIVFLNSSKLILNSGTCFEHNEAEKFIKRVMNKKIIDWVKNIDKLLSNEINEKQIKKISFSVGGKACQKKHRDKIVEFNLTGWKKGKKRNKPNWAKGLTKESDPRIAKFSKKGEKNPMYGKKYSDEEKKLKSEKMKEKILNGKFTPKSNNRNTHWESSYLNKKYRSSWEAWYQSLAPAAEYEKLRIKYKFQNNFHIYIVDFVDHQQKIVAEVKPMELCNSEKFKSKVKALTEWAESNGYTFILVTKEWLKQNTNQINYSNFDESTAEKIRKIYETN